jgi:excisionase family DNA binding protein
MPFAHAQYVLNGIGIKADKPRANGMKSRLNARTKMAKGKNVLTTGDVAKICNVAPRTVSKWFDSGQLKGYRIPGSKDRRIPVNELIRFMKQNNMPVPALPVGKMRVVIVDGNAESASKLAQTLKAKSDYEVSIAKDTFEAGTAVQRFEPHVLLVNLLSKDIDAAEICRNIRSDEELQTIKIIALVNHLGNGESAALLQKGFDGYVSMPADASDIVRKIEEATAIIY